MNITGPLRLAIGSHQKGSGKGCAMNVVSWENGDTEITDMPDCSDPMLARVVQRVNDTICDHRAGDLLCPECSIAVLDLAHRTVGTRLDHLTAAERSRVYVRLALEEARSVAPVGEDARVTEARALVAAWLRGDKGVAKEQLRSAANAADAAADAAAYYHSADAYYHSAAAVEAANAAANAAATAANTAYYSADANAANAAANAANAAYYSVNTAYYSADAIGGDRPARAHQLIDRFEALTGVKAPTPDATAVERAYAEMVSAS